MPVSSTHIKTCAIMGVGAVKRLSAINFGVVKDMMFTVLHLPACGLISFVMAAVHDVPLIKPNVHPDRNTSPTRLRLERTHHGKETRFVLLDNYVACADLPSRPQSCSPRFLRT
ncbi:MAG: inorganic phosphate transporter [Collinsella sp.]